MRRLTRKLDLESVAVSPEHQGKGIGAAMMKYVTDVLDEKNSPCLLRASVMGKPLYEKFGWKVLAAFERDFKEYGWEDKVYRNWYMRREPVGKGKSG